MIICIAEAFKNLRWGKWIDYKVLSHLARRVAKFSSRDLTIVPKPTNIKPPLTASGIPSKTGPFPSLISCVISTNSEPSNTDIHVKQAITSELRRKPNTPPQFKRLKMTPLRLLSKVAEHIGTEGVKELDDPDSSDFWDSALEFLSSIF